MGSIGNAKSSASGKAFYQLTVPEKRQRIESFKSSLDERFKHYKHGIYDIYNMNGNYAAYNFNPSDKSLEKFRDTSYLAVIYDKTLKSIKSKLKGD